MTFSLLLHDVSTLFEFLQGVIPARRGPGMLHNLTPLIFPRVLNINRIICLTFLAVDRCLMYCRGNVSRRIDIGYASNVFILAGWESEG